MSEVLVMGARGNMGRRYLSVLEYLGHESLSVDVPRGTDGLFLEHPWTHAIVAVPTDVHFEAVRELCLARQGIHILVEKPFAKNPEETKDIYRMAESCGNKLYCVNQYAHLPQARQFQNQDGASIYNYFKSGQDGLEWDCFQIFALARGQVILSNASPIWSCMINGVPLELGHMDWAYISMISDFLGEKRNTFDKQTVLNATEKAYNYFR